MKPGTASNLDVNRIDILARTNPDALVFELLKLPSEKFNSMLQNACVAGHLDTVKILINGFADNITQWEFTIRPAAKHGHLEVVKALLPLPQITTGYKQTALRLAASQNRLAIVGVIQANLLQQGSFHKSKEDISRDISLLLLRDLSDEIRGILRQFVENEDYQGLGNALGVLLREAAQQGLHEVAAHLLFSGYISLEDRAVALECAQAGNHTSLVNILFMSVYPLLSALRCQQLDVVETLLASLEYISVADKEAALQFAMDNSQLHEVANTICMNLYPQQYQQQSPTLTFAFDHKPNGGNTSSFSSPDAQVQPSFPGNHRRM